MRNHTLTLLIALAGALLPGCSLLGSFDACDQTSPLWNGLTAEQQTACTQCGAVDCSAGDTGETYDDDVVCHAYGMTFCAYEDVNNGAVLAEYPDAVTTSLDQCRTLAGTGTGGNTVRRVSDWGTPASSGEPVVYCDLDVPDSVLPYGPVSDDQTAWRLCKRGPTSDVYGVTGLYYPRVSSPYGGYFGNWLTHATCSEPTDTQVGSCAQGIIAIGKPGRPGRPAEWTCACSTDSDCQQGAVCEAGYHLPAGSVWPQPTICTWSEAKSANAGPTAYGLTAWADGIAVSGTTITVTAAALMVGMRGGIFNDDQRIELDGTISHCGVRSLCAYLGLDTGDQLIVKDEEALLTSGRASFSVVHPDGGTEHWTLVIAD